MLISVIASALICGFMIKYMYIAAQVCVYVCVVHVLVRGRVWACELLYLCVYMRGNYHVGHQIIIQDIRQQLICSSTSALLYPIHYRCTRQKGREY